jgi:hypothetical protein
MAIRFAKQNGNWSSASTWDGGLTSPTAGDDVYPNGFTVTLDQDVNVGCLNGGTCPQGVPLSPIPNMTNNTTPAGVGQAFASSNNVNAWQAFKKPITNFTNTGWQASVAIPQQLGFQFNTSKSIQRYSWYNGSGGNQRPRNWTFEGSNDGVTYVVLHTVAAYASAATYFSPAISNPSSYTYYRINVTAVQSGTGVWIDYLDMTESTALGNGYGTNGQFNSSANRTITCTGFGIIRPNFGAALVVNITGSSTTTNIIGNIAQYYSLSQTITGIVVLGGGTNTLNITGDVFIDSAALNGRGRVLESSASTNIINVVGNVYSYSTNTNDATVIQHISILNITGNVINYGGADTTFSRVIVGNTVTSVHNITGNIIGPIANGGYCVVSGILNLTGNLTCTAGIFPISVHRLRISPSTSISFRLQDTTNANRFMYTSAQNIGQAATNDVRTGVVYGPNNDYTGTCAVPPAGAVSLGVPVDNTTGTAYLSGNDISAAVWDTQTTNLSASGSIGERLKNASTVDTTAATVAAYDI